MPKLQNRPLRVFFCHASQDKPAVRELYKRLEVEGWIDPWLDEEKLYPGQDWDLEIEKAVEAADAVIVFLSNNSVTKEGYIQRELRFVLRIADFKPEGTVFVIPVRLDDCPMPRRLSMWQYVDYFPGNRKGRAYQRLKFSLTARAEILRIPTNYSKVEKEVSGLNSDSQELEDAKRIIRIKEIEINAILAQAGETIEKEREEKAKLARELKRKKSEKKFPTDKKAREKNAGEETKKEQVGRLKVVKEANKEFPLRVYLREVEEMIDHGHLNEAIAHCCHILNEFPKNLVTYRLLGKAYLEDMRYSDAKDIFERVLKAVPDDFVAHVGLSIIGDEQSNLIAATWHIERAFEVQPSNAAIEVELQRLYQCQCGANPPKIRLTRGALARMYIESELYSKAISEIQAILEEDKERLDVQALLPRIFFKMGQRREAAEMCLKLLQIYPYWFDINRVLIDILADSKQFDVDQYRQRVNELDPYAAFVNGSTFNSDEVPDDVVCIERLDWDGRRVEIDKVWWISNAI